MTDDELNALLTKPATRAHPTRAIKTGDALSTVLDPIPPHADDCPLKILEDVVDQVKDSFRVPESPVVASEDRDCWICRANPCEPSCSVQRQKRK